MAVIRYMDTPNRLLGAFETFQKQRQQLEQKFVQDMTRIEEKLKRFSQELQEKQREAQESADNKKEQLQEIAKHAERLMAAMQSKGRSSWQ